MRAFLLRILVFALPFAAVTGAYVVLDPFKVLYTYERFVSHNPVSINVDYLSTESYLRHRDERHWDAFLFGSSRTLAFRAEDWMPYLDDANPLRFNASRESLYGVVRKLELIDAMGDPIRYALVLVDADLLSQVEDSSGHLYVKHPRLSGRPWLDFELLFLRAWFQDFFFVRYLDHRLTGATRPYMRRVINTNRMEIGPAHNDLRLVDQEAWLARDPDAYYAHYRPRFERARHHPHPDGPVIGERQRALLLRMREIFEAHGTRYRIVVSPNFAWPPLAEEDLGVLRRIFGADRVHDFSDRSAITEDPRNYYEQVHFRPHVGRRILAEIYAGAEDVREASGGQDGVGNGLHSARGRW